MSSLAGAYGIDAISGTVGRRDSVAYPNGTVAKYRFDQDGRFRDLDVIRSGSTQLSLRYSNYDALHNNIEFVHGPGTDDPLVALAPPGQAICATSAAYFVTGSLTSRPGMARTASGTSVGHRMVRLRAPSR
ncbi:MAG: hypothetical protein ACRERX_23775, partial [Pseudomonas sp.]